MWFSHCRKSEIPEPWTPTEEQTITELLQYGQHIDHLYVRMHRITNSSMIGLER